MVPVHWRQFLVSCHMYYRIFSTSFCLFIVREAGEKNCMKIVVASSWMLVLWNVCGRLKMAERSLQLVVR